MTYSDILASRGYQRRTVERTDKAPGSLVYNSVTRKFEKVEKAA